MPQRKVFKDYDESDVQAVCAQSKPTSWSDLISYLHDGLSAQTGVPAGTAHMIADAKQAMKDNVPFPHSPEQAYRIMKSHRNPELVRQEEQHWLARTRQLEDEARTANRPSASRL